jgi:hypothetical protein
MVDIDRIATLIEWSHEPHPLALAPDVRMGETWLHTINPMWLPGLTKKPHIIGGREAHRALRGRRGGTLVVVKAGYRDGEWPHRLNDRVDDALIEFVPYTEMTVWTEWLP